MTVDISSTTQWSFGRRVGRDAPQGGAGCAVGLHRRRHLFTIGSVVPSERRCGHALDLQLRPFVRPLLRMLSHSGQIVHLARLRATPGQRS